MKTENLQNTFTLGNIAIIAIGLIVLAIGINRIAPFRFDKGFFLQNGPLAVILIAMFCFCWRKESSAFTEPWLKASIGLSARFLPLMVLLCLVMGIGTVLARVYGKEISGFLLRHPLMTPIIGSWVAPTPNTMVPIIESMWEHLTLRPGFIYFLNAASLMSLPLFMLRQLGFKNPEISTKMYISGVIISLCTALFMKQLSFVVNLVYDGWMAFIHWFGSLWTLIFVGLPS